MVPYPPLDTRPMLFCNTHLRSYKTSVFSLNMWYRTWHICFRRGLRKSNRCR